jgi:hypothetical protein
MIEIQRRGMIHDREARRNIVVRSRPIPARPVRSSLQGLTPAAPRQPMPPFRSVQNA